MGEHIESLAAEFARLDQQGADGYVYHDGDDEDWPTVGFRAGDGGHVVISIHPDDIAKGVAVLQKYPDGAANLTGPESFLYDPIRAFKVAGIRCKWGLPSWG